MEAPALVDEELLWSDMPLCLHISQRWAHDGGDNLYLECEDCGDLQYVEPGSSFEAEWERERLEGERYAREDARAASYRRYLGDHRG